MKKITLLLFLLSARLTFGQIINGGFEVWDTTYPACYFQELEGEFEVPDPKGGVMNQWSSGWCGMGQTTDSHSGDYALLLFNWYVDAVGTIEYNGNISSRPLYLQGYFKYIKGGIDHQARGKANVTLTRFNGTSRDTIATGTCLFDPVDSYTAFQLTFNYISESDPDSLSMFIINADESSGSGGLVCNLLYLDDLILSDSPLSVENPTEDLATVYPNPSCNELSIHKNSDQSVQFTLYNAAGEKILDKLLTNQTSTINLSSFPVGIYFYKFIVDNTRLQTGKIIKY